MNAKKLQNEIEHSLLGASQVLFRDDDWRFDRRPKQLLVREFLRACAANLAQGYADLIDEGDDNAAE